MKTQYEDINFRYNLKMVPLITGNLKTIQWRSGEETFVQLGHMENKWGQFLDFSWPRLDPEEFTFCNIEFEPLAVFFLIKVQPMALCISMQKH